MLVRIFAAVFALILFCSNIAAAYAPEGKLYITMLDIGQGDAFLIETHEQNILIDTGDTTTAAKLVAILRDTGINRFERIILTHPHADHIGGVNAVVENFIVDRISDNGFISTSPLYIKYHELPVTFDTLRAGDIVDFGAGVKFNVLYPNVTPQKSVNNQSIVGKLTYGEFSMLFTGDIGRTAEDELYKTYGDELHAVILKAPHHGSQSGSSEDFISVVAPDYVFISAGKGNRFGHPHKKPLRTYRSNFVLAQKIFCTRFNGTVRLETDGKNNLIYVERINDWVEDYTGERITAAKLD